jgi:small membrane protein
MRLIQFILAPLLILLLIWIGQRLKHQIFLKGFLVVLLSLGIVLSFFPDISQWFSQQLGVGRGVDLLFYTCIVGLIVTCLLLYIRLQKLEQQLTKLIRKQSLDQAKTPNLSNNNKTDSATDLNQ